MAEQPTYIFLPEDQCLSESQLFDYIDGKLKASEMHLAEKHILSCGFCSDALEGLEKVKSRDKVASFIPFSKEKEKEEKPKVIPLNPNRKYFAMAAAVVLLVALTFVMKITFNNEPGNAKMADLVQKDSIAAPQKENAPVYRKADPVPNEQQEINGIISDNKPGDSKTGPVADKRTIMQSPAPAPKLHDVTAKKTTEEPKTAGDGEDQDDFVNIVDAKAAPEQDKYYDANNKDLAKQEIRAEDQQQKKAKAPVAVKNADTKASGEKNVLDESTNIPMVTTTESTQAKGASTGTFSGGTSPNYTRTPQSTTTNAAPASGSSVNVTVTDSVSGPAVNEKEVQGNLSYENGVKMLNSGQAAASLAMFDKVLDDPDHPHYLDAKWKKAEALIQLKRIDEAKTLLNELAAKPGKYQQKAKEKLKSL